jgi:selenocysteine-specific elongation factor
LLADAEFWKDLCQFAADWIDVFHRAHPEQPGIPLSQLRAKLVPVQCPPEAFEPLLIELVNSGFDRAGTAICRRAHRAVLPGHLEAAGARVRAALAAKPLDPPSRKELAPDQASQQALRFLIQNGEAIELNPDIALLAESFQRAADMVRKHLLEHGSATVSQLRQSVGASRRIVVPLLEKLDRDGLTRRQNDLRFLRR